MSQSQYAHGYTTGRRMAASRLRLSLWGSVKAEFTKLLSIKSTWWLLGITILLIVAGAALSGVTYKTVLSLEINGETGEITQLSTPKPIDALTVWQSVTALVSMSSLVLGIAGIMAITSEYTNLTIQSGLTANPRRGMFLAAKAIAAGALSFVASFVGVTLAWVALQLVYSGVTITPLTDEQRMVPLVILLGAPLLCVLMTLFALGLGAICRSTAGAVFLLIGIWMILPSILSIATMSETLAPTFRSIANCLPDQSMYRFLEGAIANSAGTGSPTSSVGLTLEVGTTSTPLNYFDPTWWQSGLIFVAWAALSYCAGLLVMKRSDIK